MNLKIHSIQHRGDKSKECMVLEALEDCDLSDYAVVDTACTPEGELNSWRHFHWFKSQRIRKGDYIVLRTRKGNDRARNSIHMVSKLANKTYERHWNADSAIWSDGGEHAALLHLTWADSRKMSA